jgi:hypothetical protein
LSNKLSIRPHRIWKLNYVLLFTHILTHILFSFYWPTFCSLFTDPHFVLFLLMHINCTSTLFWIILRDFIVLFSYMHMKYFNDIYLLTLSFQPPSSHLNSPMVYISINFFRSRFCIWGRTCDHMSVLVWLIST